MSPTSYHCSTPRYSHLLYAGNEFVNGTKTALAIFGGVVMARRGRAWYAGKWALIGGAVGAGAALISLLPVIKRRAMRVTTILKKDHKVVSGLIMTLQMTPRINGTVRKTLFDQIRRNVMVHA